MITLVPVGGLANRMRAIASAAMLAKRCNSPLRVIWFKDQGLNCRFDELFRTDLPYSRIQLAEASWLDLLLYDRPRKRNFRMTRFPQQWLFNSCIREEEIIRKRDEGFDFTAWGNENKKVHIASYITFVPYPYELLQALFRPNKEIEKAIDKITGSFDDHTIGIHIRRTDNIQSINLSPLTLFIEQIEKDIQKDERANFYLASDSPEDKAKLVELFGNRIRTHQFTTDRNSSKGIQDAATELFVLSRTQKIIGSAWSSFSEIAAQLTGIPCIILKKEQ